MSSKLKPVDLSSAGVGFTATIDFNQFVKFLPNDMTVKAHIRILNESGCGLDIAFQASGNSHSLPAGAWGTFDLEPNDGSVQITVTYTLPNPPVSLLLSIYYAPGETVPQAFTLGNSPIGIGGSVTTSSVQTLSNELNAANTLVLDIGDTALNQLIALFTDHFLFKVDQSGVAHAVIKGSTSGNAAQIGQTGDTSEILGSLLVDQNQTVTGTQTITGDATFNGAGTGVTIAHALSSDGATITSSGSGALTALSLIAKFINLSPTTVTASGQAGTATLYQFCQGTIKAFLIYFNGWRDNSGSRKTLTLPVAFTNGGIGLQGGMAGGASGIYYFKSGSANTTNQVTGRNAAITGTTPNVSFIIVEVPTGGIDTISIDANTTVAATGWVFFIGT